MMLLLSCGGGGDDDDDDDDDDVFLHHFSIPNVNYDYHFILSQVFANVEEITKDRKVINFKLRRRKNSKRTKGHRRQLTILRITDIIRGQST